jgi:hypothetical protein
MAPRHPNRQCGSGRRDPRAAGSVILLVLMTLLLTAFALTKYLERTTIDLLADARAAGADRLRVEAYSALETVLAVLQEFRTVNGSLRSPTEGWGEPLGFASYAPPEGLKVEVMLEDESGRLSLPQADFQTLRDLFVLLDQKETEAERLADALLVWMQPGYEPSDSFSARATDYERAAVPHDPPRRSLHSYAELAGIKFVRERMFDEQGHPNELWRRFAASVSLFKFTSPNTNAALPTTLAALGSYDDTNVQKITDYLGGLGSFTRQGPTWFRAQQDVASLLGPAASSKLGTQVRCLRVNVTVHEGPTSFKLSAVVAAPGDAQPPPANPQINADGDTTAATDQNSSPSRPTDASRSPPGTGGASGTGTGTGATSQTTTTTLNYPFTLLEIRENDEMVGPQAAPGSSSP